MPSDFDPIDDPYWEDADVGYDTCKAEEIMEYEERCRNGEEGLDIPDDDDDDDNGDYGDKDEKGWFFASERYNAEWNERRKREILRNAAESSNNDKLNNRSAEPSSTNEKEEAGDGTLAGQAGSTSKSEYTKPWTGGTEDFMTSRNEIDRISVSEGYRKMADNMRKVAGKDGGDGGKKK